MMANPVAQHFQELNCSPADLRFRAIIPVSPPHTEGKPDKSCCPVKHRSFFHLEMSRVLFPLSCRLHFIIIIISRVKLLNLHTAVDLQNCHTEFPVVTQIRRLIVSYRRRTAVNSAFSSPIKSPQPKDIQISI